MSPGQEYRQLLVRIGKASLARKMRKPYPWAIVDTVIFSSLAALVLVAVLLVLAALCSKTMGGASSKSKPADTGFIAGSPTAHGSSAISSACAETRRFPCR